MKWSVTYTDNSGIGPESWTYVVDAESEDEAREQIIVGEGWSSLEEFEEEDDYDYQVDAYPIRDVGYVAVLTDRSWVPDIAYVCAESEERALELAKDEFVNSGKCKKEDIEDTVNITVHCLPNRFQSE
jgi:hypothetical protein